MTKTGLEFEILVIVICLIFDICDLEFSSHFSRLLQGGKSIEAPSGGRPKSGPLCFLHKPPSSVQTISYF